ncbi:PadR family transcriptional regulator [Asticcacaulis solisilvae]|uniref:PadR family transcriptional regulator n=1 Tax=Asticcacaulis solisilvae TaxID=1217274 RepID=UPI003FD6F68B
MPAKVTPLGYALLGLLRGEPRSGYALRKVFETTLLGNYSSSPGSIYPALKGLEKAELIAAEPIARGNVFSLTPMGREALDAWLTAPAQGEPADILMLRFAFLQELGRPEVTRAFLISFADAARGSRDGIRAFMAGDIGPSMPLQSRLAVDFGLRNVEAQLAWAENALKQLEDHWSQNAPQTGG